MKDSVTDRATLVKATAHLAKYDPEGQSRYGVWRCDGTGCTHYTRAAAKHGRPRLIEIDGELARHLAVCEEYAARPERVWVVVADTTFVPPPVEVAA